MAGEGDDTAGSGRPSPRALDELLSGLPEEARPESLEHDEDWLRFGLSLGLEHPHEARRLLERIGAPGTAKRAAAGGLPPVRAGEGGHPVASGTARADASAREAPVTGTAGMAGAADETQDTAGEDAAGDEDVEGIPFRSRLIARSAASAGSSAAPGTTGAGVDPGPAFGWAGTLTRGEVIELGQVVEEMLRAGAPSDIRRGFGIAWRAGVRLPRPETDTLIGDFVELEITLAGVLAGYDVRASAPLRQSRGLERFFDFGRSRSRPGEAQAAMVIEQHGEAALRGLVAAWNAWVALRYRDRVPPATFELLVRPWVTVVGPLPES